MADTLTIEQRANLNTKYFDESELKPLSSTEKIEFLKDFANRAGNDDAAPPPPDKDVNFSYHKFDHTVIFSRYLFPTYVSFNKSHFLADMLFSDALFDGYVAFTDTSFLRDTKFDHAEFFGAIELNKARFLGPINFVMAKFHGDVGFDNAAFLSEADFRRATFDRKTVFSGSEFTSRTMFAGVKFRRSVPDFRDAKLSEATEWHGVEWPPIPRNSFDAQQQIYAYERLKAEMERLKKHDDEQFFFAKELRVRRALLWFQWRGNKQPWPEWYDDDGLPFANDENDVHMDEKLSAFTEKIQLAFAWLLNFVYDILSCYGRSIERPIFWIFFIFLLGAFVLAVMPSLDSGSLEPWSAAAVSATNLFSLLPNKPDTEITDHLSTLAKVVGDIQSVLGIVLLFLLGLALRNRFRMR